MSRRTLVRNIDTAFEDLKQNIKKKLTSVSNVCTTADVWSSGNRSYLGVTAHWIDEATFKRGSATLACTRFKGAHTFDKIAEKLQDLHFEFALNHKKIVATVTDNGRNFIKAFKEFGIDTKFMINDNVGAETVSDDDQNSDETLNFLYIPFDENCIDSESMLPHHVSCASHSLNLVGVKDAVKGLKHVSRTYTNILSKCSALWNSFNWPKSAEVIQETLHCSIKTPCATRWNSLFDSIQHLIENKDKLQNLFKKLNIIVLKDSEIEFLVDYVSVLKPVAMALDRLQSNCMYGELIPTLLAIQKKLNNIKLSESSKCKGLLEAVSCGLETRFSKYLNAEDNASILATVSHPFFKMRWVKDQLSSKQENILSLFKHAVKEEASMVPVLEEKSTNNAVPQTDLFEDFFELSNESNEGLSNENALEIEVLHYIRDTHTDIHMLNRYPNVKRVYLKYNTILSSSAPVERLFSFGSLIRTPRRRSLSDELFEKLIMCKTSSKSFD